MKILLFIVGVAIGAGALYGYTQLEGTSCFCEGSAGPGAGDVLAAARKAGVLKVGVKTDAPPFGWKDEHGWYGFDIDIANAITKDLGIEKIEFVGVTSQNRLDLVASGEIDVLIASTTITRARDEKVDFSIPYFQDGQALLVRAGAEIGSYTDLAGKAVGAVKGTTSVNTIKEVQPDCKIKAYAGYAEALDGLRNGDVAALTSDMLILKGLLLSAEDADKFRIAGERFSTEPYGIAIAQNQSAMRDAVNDALQRMWETGRWQRTFENWFGSNARYSSDVDFTIVPFLR